MKSKVSLWNLLYPSEGKKVWVIFADKPEIDFVTLYWCSGADIDEVWHWKATKAIRFVEAYDALQVIDAFKAGDYEKITGNKLGTVQIIIHGGRND
jgi:hypothetical protein